MITLYQLEEAWQGHNKHRIGSFLDYLKTKYNYDFNTVIELNDENTYKMIKTRLQSFYSEVDERRKVVDMWETLNWSHPYFMNSKELNFNHPQYLIEPKMVNDEGIRDNNESKNVNLVYWFEVLIPFNPDKTHQCNIIHYGGVDKIPQVAFQYESEFDGSAKTYEKAIESIYDLVCTKYGYPEGE